MSKSNFNVIVCDIQPMYEPYIMFNISKFCKNYLNKVNKICYYYNGIEETGHGKDNKDDILNWLYDNGLSENKIKDISFIDKGFGYLRDWMDSKVHHDLIIKTLKHLQKHNLNSSDDIEDICNFLPYKPSGNISIPVFNLPDVNIFNNAKLIGGAKDYCLKELELYFNAYNIKYCLNKRYLY